MPTVCCPWRPRASQCRDTQVESELPVLCLPSLSVATPRITSRVHMRPMCSLKMVFKARFPRGLHNTGVSLMSSNNGTQVTQMMLSCTQLLWRSMKQQDTKKQRDALAPHIPNCCYSKANNSASGQSHQWFVGLVPHWEHGKEELQQLLGRQELQHRDRGGNNDSP